MSTLVYSVSLIAACQTQSDRNASRSKTDELLQQATSLSVLETIVSQHRTDVTVRYRPEFSNPDSAFARLAVASEHIWNLPEFADNSDTIAITVAREVRPGLMEKNTFFYYRDGDRRRSR